MSRVANYASRDDVVETVCQRERATIIRNAVDRLPRRNRAVIKILFGIGATEQNGVELGRQMGVTKMRVSQLKKSGIKRLRAMLAHEYKDGDL